MGSLLDSEPLNDRTDKHMSKTNFDVGWGVVSLKDQQQVDYNRMPKPHVRGFDEKRKHQAIY